MHSSFHVYIPHVQSAHAHFFAEGIEQVENSMIFHAHIHGDSDKEKRRDWDSTCNHRAKWNSNLSESFCSFPQYNIRQLELSSVWIVIYFPSCSIRLQRLERFGWIHFCQMNRKHQQKHETGILPLANTGNLSSMHNKLNDETKWKSNLQNMNNYKIVTIYGGWTVYKQLMIECVAKTVSWH